VSLSVFPLTWNEEAGRVKDRDWYDLVWYAANHPQLHLSHLEQRMRQSGHWKNEGALSEL
jgi:beta-xylosidase